MGGWIKARQVSSSVGCLAGGHWAGVKVLANANTKQCLFSNSNTMFPFGTREVKAFVLKHNPAA